MLENQRFPEVFRWYRNGWFELASAGYENIRQLNKMFDMNTLKIRVSSKSNMKFLQHNYSLNYTTIPRLYSPFLNKVPPPINLSIFFSCNCRDKSGNHHA